jgi:hypothetical protein
MDGRSVKTSEKGVRGFDGHKRVKGRKRHILVDVLGANDSASPPRMNRPSFGGNWQLSGEFQEGG